MTNDQQVAQLGRAIKRAVEAHGADGNSFTVGELSREYGAPPALTSGRILRNQNLSVERVAGYRLTYLPGRPCKVRATTALDALSGVS